MRAATWRHAGIAKWTGRGFWAVTDQGLFALSNFALNVLLARWLVPAEYGAFAVAYTVFLLLGTVHTGILTEPMQVFGPGKYKDRLPGYLQALLKGHLAFGLMSSALFALAAFVLWRFTDNLLAPAVLGLAIASPFILFQWLMRRACYADMRPQLAAGAGALYMGLMLAGTYGVYRSGWLGPTTALGVMAAASFASGWWLVYRLQVRRAAVERPELPSELRRDHWRYGRWAIATGILSWVPGNVVYLVLPIWHGLEAAGALRALMNLVMPVLQINVALATILLPGLIQARRQGPDRLPKMTWIATGLFTTGAVAYWLTISVLAEPLLSALYGLRYMEHAPLLWVLGSLPVAGAWAATMGSALRALERPERVMRAYAISTAVTLTVGLACIWLWGVAGTVIALILSSLTTASILTLMLGINQRSTLSFQSCHEARQ